MEAASPEDPARKTYADKVRQTYNFAFGKGNISLPGNAAVVGNDFFNPAPFQMQPIADIATRRHITNGVSRCMQTPSEPRFTAPASTSCRAPRALNSRVIAIAATIHRRACGSA